MTSLFQTISSMHRPLDFHRDRHNVLASNIANADTPGFEPSDLVREEGSMLGTSMALRSTDQAHFGVSAGESVTPFEARPDPRTAVGRDGNSVSIEHEMSRLGANDLRYDAVAEMVKRHIGMLRYAANDGNGG